METFIRFKIINIEEKNLKFFDDQVFGYDFHFPKKRVLDLALLYGQKKMMSCYCKYKIKKKEKIVMTRNHHKHLLFQ